MTLPYRGVIGIAVLKPPEKIYESLSGGVKLQTQIYYTGTPSQTISQNLPEIFWVALLKTRSIDYFWKVSRIEISEKFTLNSKFY